MSNHLLLHEFWVEHIPNMNLFIVKIKIKMICYVYKFCLICMHKNIVDCHNTQKLRTNDREIAHVFLKINLREAEFDLVPC